MPISRTAVLAVDLSPHARKLVNPGLISNSGGRLRKAARMCVSRGGMLERAKFRGACFVVMNTSVFQGQQPPCNPVRFRYRCETGLRIADQSPSHHSPCDTVFESSQAYLRGVSSTLKIQADERPVVGG